MYLPGSAPGGALTCHRPVIEAPVGTVVLPVSPVTVHPDGAVSVMWACVTGSRPSLRNTADTARALPGSARIWSEPGVAGTDGAPRSVAGSTSPAPRVTR